MSQSILDSTKKVLNVPSDYDVFDPDIIMHINSVFSTLNQLGIGPADGFEIEDSEATWDDFLLGNPKFNFVKSYMYLRVRLLFDPPATSFLISAIESQCREHEWRMSVLRESKSTLLLGGRKTITGNLGDEHNVRLGNPPGQNLINASGFYEVDFVSSDGRRKDLAVLDSSQKATGSLSLKLIIQSGTYTVRRLDPRRTILVIEVRAE